MFSLIIGMIITFSPLIIGIIGAIIIAKKLKKMIKKYWH